MLPPSGVGIYPRRAGAERLARKWSPSIVFLLLPLCQQIVYNHKMYTDKTIRWFEKHNPNILLAAKRDGYLCCDCDNDAAVVHHIDESRKNGLKNMNNDLENLVSLCRPCHARRHGMVSDRIDVIELKNSGMTFTDIGKVFGISRQRAHQIYKTNTNRISKRLLY